MTSAFSRVTPCLFLPAGSWYGIAHEGPLRFETTSPSDLLARPAGTRWRRPGKRWRDEHGKRLANGGHAGLDIMSDVT
jgi:hypothetical protein